MPVGGWWYPHEYLTGRRLFGVDESRVFYIAGEGVFVYNWQRGEVELQFSRVDGLSSYQIVDGFYSAEGRWLVLLHSNCMVDIVDASDVWREGTLTQTPTCRGYAVGGYPPLGRAVIATSAGISLVDVERHLLERGWLLPAQGQVLAVAMDDSFVYALYDTALYALAWHQTTARWFSVLVPSSRYRLVGVGADYQVLVVGDSAVWRVRYGGVQEALRWQDSVVWAGLSWGSRWLWVR